MNTPDPASDQVFLRQAIELSATHMRAREGGPFGAVIVRAGVVVGLGWNTVTSANDPTAHAEITAIRAAAARLKTFVLDGCVLYSSCEPCPMCLAAAYWARLERIVYAGSQQDAAAAGFDDAFLYRELAAPPSARRMKMQQMLREQAAAVFAEWRSLPGKTEY